MTNAQQLAEHFQTTLGDAYDCRGSVVNLDEFPPAQLAAIVVDAPTYEPASNAMGALVLTFPVFVVVNTASSDGDAERFEEVLPAVFAAIDANGALLWTDAKPTMYDQRKPAYQITVTATNAKG